MAKKGADGVCLRHGRSVYISIRLFSVRFNAAQLHIWSSRHSNQAWEMFGEGLFDSQSEGQQLSFEDNPVETQTPDLARKE